MLQVRYIGTKPKKTDNVAGTGAIWNGNGDVQPVPESAWPKLAVHSSVWELVPALAAAAAPAVTPPARPSAPSPAPVQNPQPTAAASAPAAQTGDAPPPGSPAAPKPTYFLVNADETVINLDAMDDTALRALVVELQKQLPNMKVHSQIKGDKLRAAIVEQVNLAATDDKAGGEGA